MKRILIFLAANIGETSAPAGADALIRSNDLL